MNKIQIIVNNGAGTGSAVAVWKETKEYLQENGISYNAYLTRYEKHAVKLAGQICGKIPQGPIYLLVVGGDGTINEVLNGITDFDRVRLGVIPPGSGNDCQKSRNPSGYQRRSAGNHSLYRPGTKRRKTAADRSWESKLGRV